MATIITKNSATPSQVPSSLTQGELAINVTDGKLYYGSGSGNVVKEFTGSGGSTFPYTGSAIISGSLTVTGSFYVSNSIDSNNKQLIDNGGVTSVAWNSYRLYNSSNNLVVHWGTGNLYSGSFVTSSVSWTDRVLRDSDGTVTVDWENTLFNDSSGNASVNVGSRRLQDSLGNASVAWEEKLLANAGATTTVDWGNGVLYDSTAATSIDWERRALKDTLDNNSVAYEDRRLIANDGITIATDWTTPGTILFSGSLIPAGPYSSDTSSYDLGSSTAAWRDLYVSNGTINMIDGNNRAAIKFTNGKINFGNTPIETPNVITTASVSSNIITFTKGDGSTFPITVDTGSGGGGTQKIYNFIQSTDGATVTLTTANTLSSTLLIPANTVAVGDSISIKARASKTGTASTSRIFIYINTSATLSGATLLASGPSAAGLQIFQQLSRELIVKSSTVTESFPTGTALITDDNTTSVAISNTNIDWTTNKYFIFSLILGNANDSIKTTYSRVTVLKT